MVGEARTTSQAFVRFLACVHSRVNLETQLLRKRNAADVTHVRFVSGVRAFVLAEFSCFGEILFANLAFESFFVDVSSYVCLQVVVSLEDAVANRTLVLDHSGVSSLVLFELGSQHKGLLALVTLVRFVAAVSLHVQSEGRLVGTHNLTNAAFEHLFCVTSVLVLPKRSSIHRLETTKLTNVRERI